MSLFVLGKSLFVNRGMANEIEFPHGNLPLDPPLRAPDLSRLLNRRLYVNLRCPPIPGAYQMALDIGAPFTLFPRKLWRDQLGWQEGRHFETCRIAGSGPFLTSQLLNQSFRVRLVRLLVPVEFAGKDGDRLRVERLVAQLAEPDTPRDDPKFAVLGLFGGVFEGRKLAVDRQPADDLAARLEW